MLYITMVLLAIVIAALAAAAFCEGWRLGRRAAGCAVNDAVRQLERLRRMEAAGLLGTEDGGSADDGGSDGAGRLAGLAGVGGFGGVMGAGSSAGARGSVGAGGSAGDGADEAGVFGILGSLAAKAAGKGREKAKSVPETAEERRTRIIAENIERYGTKEPQQELG